MRLFAGLVMFVFARVTTAQSVSLSPTALAASSDGKAIYVACATANRVLCLDTAHRTVIDSFAMPASPSGLALLPDGRQLFVICAAPESTVCIVDVAKRQIVATIPAGHTAMAPVVSPNGKTLYVCNRFNNDVSVIDLGTKKEVGRVPVQREPVAAAITKDGKFLLVANHLHTGRADVDYVTAVVSVIDLKKNKVVKELSLPNGSGSLQDIQVSPDGKYAAVTHVIARFHRTTAMVNRGWMHVNAVTIIDLARIEIRNTALLDDPDSGAANPWGLGWSADGSKLVIAHAGVNEVSVSDFPMLLEQLPEQSSVNDAITNSASVLQALATRADYLPFLAGSRQRIKLPPTDLGPRALVVVGHTAYVANYFSDTLSVIDLDAPDPTVKSVPLGSKPEMDIVRKGEFYFHDAELCYQGWQSCSSCHPGDARADALNWDLLNDGVDNPKNTKSLLLAHKTPPTMSLGVRTNAEAAVRAGITHILFTKQPESMAVAIDEYLKSLKPVPSPYLVHGKLSTSAKRGERLFIQTGCADCHVPGLFTDLHSHDVGTRRTFDGPNDKFYTPTLIEIWRTAPYLHDGSAATIRDVLTARNPHDEHGETTKLTGQEIDDLCEYVLSL
jgi:YVTN family beta-propeller protein